MEFSDDRILRMVDMIKDIRAGIRDYETAGRIRFLNRAPHFPKNSGYKLKVPGFGAGFLCDGRFA